MRAFLRREFLGVCALTMMRPAAAIGGASAPDGYRNVPFTDGRIRLDVWTKGTGPLVFIFHDIGGLRQTCFDLGDDLVKENFSVAIPRFFGGTGGAFLGYIKACEGASRFRCYDLDDPGPIAPWIKALAQRGSGDGRFGAIGNCLTGILPLLMLQSDRCVAPVLCQPALPFDSYVGGDAYMSALNISKSDLELAAERTRRDQVPVLGIRYAIDKRSRPERFCTLERALADRFHCLVLEGKGHTTLLGHRSPEAYKAVLDFLKYRLLNVPWADPIPACATPSCRA